MKTVALLGLGQFNRELLFELKRLKGARVVIIDRSRETIEQYKDSADQAYIADVSREQTLRNVIEKRTHTAVIDLGADHAIVAVVVAYLKRLGVPVIIAKTETDESADVLTSMGVNQIVLPGLDAAQRIGPSLLLSGMRSFTPISQNLGMAEVSVPEALAGHSIASSNVGSAYKVNIVAVRRGSYGEYSFPDLDYEFAPTDLVLVAGTRAAIRGFADPNSYTDTEVSQMSFLRRVFRGVREQMQ